MCASVAVCDRDLWPPTTFLFLPFRPLAAGVGDGSCFSIDLGENDAGEVEVSAAAGEVEVSAAAGEVEVPLDSGGVEEASDSTRVEMEVTLDSSGVEAASDSAVAGGVEVEEASDSGGAEVNWGGIEVVVSSDIV